MYLLNNVYTVYLMYKYRIIIHKSLHTIYILYFNILLISDQTRLDIILFIIHELFKLN